MLLICGVVPAFLFFIHLFIISTRGRILSGRRPTFFGCLASGILSGQRPTFSGCLASGILSANVLPSPDVSHPEFCPPTSHLLRMSHIRNSIRPTSHLLLISIRRHSTFSGCLTSGILFDRHPTFSGCLTSEILSTDIPPSPDVSHPEFCPPMSHLLQISHIRNSVWPTSHLLRMSHIRNSVRPTSYLFWMSHIRNSVRRHPTFS